jgi:hypothetical protein
MKLKHGSRRFNGLICGIIMAVVGAYTLGVHMGWIPPNLLSGVPFFPLALLAFGALVIYHALIGKNRGGESKHDSGSCC